MDFDELHSFFVSGKLNQIIKSPGLAEWIKTYSCNFICPICKCVLKETAALKWCMHKFCDGCIKEVINRRNRRCPICKAPITTIRDVGRDFQYDAVKKEFYIFWDGQITKEELIEDTILFLRPHSSSAVIEILTLRTNARATGKFLLDK